jgi:hypothetical protein
MIPFVPTNTVQPVEVYLAAAKPYISSLIVTTHATAVADPNVGKARGQSKAIGNWSDSTQRKLERLGILQTWNDGSTVRVGTQSIYAHILNLIVETHPADGPSKPARVPKRVFAKGYHRARKPHSASELANLTRANEARAEASKKRKEESSRASSP